MLLTLAVRNIVLIEAVDLEFSPGLVTITGETGAGKSILLDALGLALGERATAGLVRQGAGSASVVASFVASHDALAWAAAQGVEVDADEPLILRRTLKADGGSRAFVGGTPVSAAQLRELGELLVEVHGQHDDRGLIAPAGHRALLDAFARTDLGPLSAAWQALQAARAAVDELTLRAEQARRDEEWLRHAADELRTLAPQEGEEGLLAARRQQVQQQARLHEDLDQALGHVGGAEGALARLRQAARVLDRLSREVEPLRAALDALDDAIGKTAEVEDALLQLRSQAGPSESELEADEARLFELRAMARKHRTTPDALPALLADMEAQLATIDGDVTALEAARASVAAAEKRFGQMADAVGAVRRAAAPRLDAAVAAELAPLKLDAARFRTLIDAAPAGEAGSDRVEFQVSTNPGAPFGPLSRIASGGEQARFMLALKVALAGVGGVGTLIFDEIDRGVGGATASAIGERLARLGSERQVIVVTHSPQVAARGTAQLRIKKGGDGLVTRTSLERLDMNERVEEIARMLSGATVTDEARAQATRLLA